MRAVIYSRVSSDPRGHGRSVDEQERDCRELAEREGWTVERVFTDSDRSASRYAKKTRPAYKALVEFVRSGGCDVLITWEASRFARDLQDYLKLRELCREANVLWSYSGRTYDLSRTDDRLSTGLDALLAERESDVTRERVLRAVRANAIKGQPHGRVLFGYEREYDPKTKAFVRQVIKEDEAELIREAAKRVLAGESCYSIAMSWNRRGIPASHTGWWDTTRIKRILTNPGYIAKRVHQGQIIGEGTWEPILDESTFYQLSAKFNDPERSKFTSPARLKYLLSSIARCGECGGQILVRHPKGYPSYTCIHNFCVGRRVDRVDQLIEKLIIARLSQPDAIGLFSPQDDELAKKALERVTEKRARLNSFYDAAASGEITATALGRIEATLLPEIEALENSLKRVDVPTAVYELARAPEVWESLTLEQKREVIRSLLEIRIHRSSLPRGSRTFDPEAIKVEWRGSPSGKPLVQPKAVEPSQAVS